MAKRKNILAVASGGGHWVQLLRLRPAFEGRRVAFVTVRDSYRADVGDVPFYVINDATRWDKLGLARMCLRLLWIILRERPGVIISTGAAPGYFALRFGKLLGARTIWLDSIANVEQMSMTGCLVRRHADLWLTQWPHLAAPDAPPVADGLRPACLGAVL
jgi:UDP-N-acetylglucosamine:LPS N-acetylglucosamine transferase